MADNQVTVRFESTSENNDRVSYAKIIPFVKTSDPNPINGKQYYIINSSGIYAESKSPTFLPGITYFEQNYTFLKDVNYYCIENGDYRVVSTSAIYANIDYYVKNATFLLSGPIEIFATVDVLYSEEGDDRIAHPTAEEMENPEYFSDDEFDIDLYTRKTGNKIALYSPFVTELASSQLGTYDSNVIIFVENVNRDDDTQTNRGAYFYYIGSTLDDSGAINGEWQEILLGTHSHHNIASLESIADIPTNKDSQRIVVVNPDGTFSSIDYESKENSSCLPDLPENILDKIKDAEYLKSLEEPDETKWHHLDADLAKLSDTYDWMKKDENGNYTNLAVGNCRELYRQLLKADKKLWITDDFKLSDKEGKVWVQLEAFKVNFNTDKNYEDCLNAIPYEKTDKQIILTADFNWNVYSSDKMILFYGPENKMLHKDIDYTIGLVDKNKVSFIISKRSVSLTTQDKLTVLFLRDAESLNSDDLMGLYEAFADEKLNIYEIDAELIRIYVQSEFARRPDIPRLYLSTNEYGNLEWTNRLLPAQHFYATRKADLIENNIVYEGEIYSRLTFKNVNYKVEEDFPILTINQWVIYDGIIAPESGKDLIYYIPVANNDDITTSDVIQLVVVKNNVAESISEEISKNYISRDDAIAILSHGKINLSEYAKHKDLLNFSKVSHIHTQYALRDHNHDFRYANYHHTHPELSALITTILTAKTEIEKPEDLNKLRTEVKIWMNQWLADLAERDKDTLNKFIKSLGLTPSNGNYYITETNVLVQDTTLLDGLNARLESCDLEPISGPIYLHNFIEQVIRLFEYDKVWAHQVELENDIPIYLKNGPIGGLDQEKANRTNLEDILFDIINPRDILADVRDVLTPSKAHTIIHFYRWDSSEDKYVQIRHPEAMRFPVEIGRLAFKIEPRNSKNKECKYFVNGKERQFWLKIDKHIHCNYDIDEYRPDFYIYSDNFKFGSNTNELTPIEITWDDIPIWDNYGITEGQLIDSNDKIPDNIVKNVFTEVFEDEFKYGDIILHNEVPEFFCGVVDDVNNFNINSLVGEYEDKRYPLSLKAGQSFVVLIQSEYENTLKILEKNNGDIKKFCQVKEDGSVHFDEYEEGYYVYYYTVLADIDIFDVKVSIDRSQKKHRIPMLHAYDDDGNITLKYV